MNLRPWACSWKHGGQFWAWGPRSTKHPKPRVHSFSYLMTLSTMDQRIFSSKQGLHDQTQRSQHSVDPPGLVELPMERDMKPIWPRSLSVFHGIVSAIDDATWPVNRFGNILIAKPNASQATTSVFPDFLQHDLRPDPVTVDRRTCDCGLDRPEPKWLRVG